MSESYLSNPNLKAVGVPVAFTQEQVEEYQRCAADCDYFVQHYVKIVHVDRGLIPFELFDFQRSIIRSFVQENKVIVRLPRQMGKCFDVNTIITVKDTNTGIIDKMTIGEFYAQISKNTTISTTKKDSRTTETIYREGRGNRLRDMSLLSYDFNRPDISYQSNSQDFPERVCETSPPSFTELFTETIRTSEGEQESSISTMSPLSDRVTRKFVESFCLSNFEIWTDTGWKPISAVHKTVPYQEWILVTEKGKRLVCADTHIVFRENGKEVFVKNLLPDDVILTDAGVERVCSIQETSTYNHMYDVTVESEDHRFYTNGILSHNTTTTAAFFLWYILFHDDKVCAILANKAATAREILSRIKLAYEHLPLWLQQGVVEWNKGSIALENGSRVLAAATSSSGIRGYSLSLVFLDEFAHVHNNIAEEFFTSIFPTISSGKDTKILIASTPNGLNHFYKFWVDAEEKRNGFVPLYFSWNAHPDRDHEWMEKQLQVLGDVKFRQEVLCDFLGSSDTLISGAALSKLVYHVPLRTEQHLDVYEDPIDHHTYVITCDVSHGLDQDASAFSVFDVTTVPYKQVAKYHNATIPPLLLPTILSNVGTTYNRAFILVELNDVGTQVAESLHHDLEYENLFRTEGFQQRGAKVTAGFKRRVLMGLRMTEPVKRIGCSNLKTLIERDKLQIHDFATISELSTFTQQGNTYKADEGYHDDLAMTLVLFGWLASQKYFREANNTDIRQTLELENENTDWLSFGFQGAEPDAIEEVTVEDQTIWIPIGKTMQDVINEKFSIL